MPSVATRKPCWDASGPHRKCSCPAKVRVYSTDGRRRLILPCRRRLCEHCGPWHWRPTVQAGLHSGLRARPQEEYLAVLLTAPGDVDPVEYNADASRRWHHFVTLLRREYPLAKLDYWRVAELQQRGHVHFHFVLRGLRYLSIEGLRKIAVQAGFGRWVGVKRPRDYPGGVRSLGWYFSKYLLKRYQARAIGVTKLVTMSQGWRVGWEDRRQPSTGKWVFAGAVGGSWAVLGHVAAEVRPSPAAAYRPAWWWSHWRTVRKRETLPIAMGLKGG